ncbi:hypothetical protein D3C71_2032500 [compost metagenome]
MAHHVVELAPLLGQRDAAAMAVEQAGAQLVLQLLDLPAERRLGDAKLDRRLGKTAKVGHLNKVAQFQKFHRGTGLVVRPPGRIANTPV